MKFLRAVLSVIALSAAVPSLAQATPETLANEVLIAYQNGDIDEFTELVTASPLLDSTATLTAQIKTNIQTLLDIYGPVEGWELVQEKSVSNRYVENSYLIFQNEYATRLKLSFYKRSSGWIIASFTIDDSIGNLLEEAD
tara:strand:+ start:4469 stop:4888 length:420 start_codon:yes stop_codon:yes gene_type:complete